MSKSKGKEDMNKSASKMGAFTVAKCAECGWYYDVPIGQAYDWDEVKSIADKHTKGTGHRTYMLDAKTVTESRELQTATELLALENNAAKTLHNSDISGAKQNVPDIVTFGDGDTFKLICKASSKAEGWMKSTKAMEISTLGVVVQVTTQQGDNVAEALVFVPGAVICGDEKTGRTIRSRQDIQ